RNGLHLHGLPGSLRRCNHWFCCEIEGHTENVRILDVEEAFLVQVVRLPPQRPTDYLFTQQLRPESSNTEDMGHCVRIPSFREHRYRDHATNALPKLPRFADGVHHLAQQLLVGDTFASSDIPSSLDSFSSKSLDFIRRHGTEVLV